MQPSAEGGKSSPLSSTQSIGLPSWPECSNSFVGNMQTGGRIRQPTARILVSYGPPLTFFKIKLHSRITDDR